MEDEFERRLLESIQDSIAIGYNPTRSADMVSTWGGVGTARRLIVSGDIQDGVRKIVSMGRPELAMESIMLEPQFAELFSDGERDAARWRLDQLA